MEVTAEAAEQARRAALRLEAARRYPGNRSSSGANTTPCNDCGVPLVCCHSCDGHPCAADRR